MPKRRLYNKTLEGKCDNQVTDYLEGETVEPGWILFVTAGSLEDEGSSPDTMAFGKKNGNKFTPMEETESPSAGIRYTLEKTHHFIAGEKPAIRFEGATTNDKYRAYLEGYYEKVTPDA